MTAGAGDVKENMALVESGEGWGRGREGVTWLRKKGEISFR